MQIVYISNRPRQLYETLCQVVTHMPFVSEAVVCCPVTDAPQLSSLPIKVRLILEHELLDSSQQHALVQLDHQSRNYFLRRELIAQDFIAEQFILSDDDARPLQDIPLTTFIKNDKHRNYYFYDLAAWRQNQTEFDQGQLSTLAVLQQLNLPHLAYASHMPQIIWRDLYRESNQFFDSYSKEFPLCEWATYFNYARHHHAQKFTSPEPYVTLCWPEHPLAWRVFCEPNQFLFENYTRHLYQSGHVFSILIHTDNNELSAIEKIIVWKKHTLALQYPEQSKGYKKYLNPRTWANKFRPLP